MLDNIDLKEAVRRAMQTEKNAMDFYKRGAEMMKNTEAKKVFELLAREESEHAEWFYNVYPGDDIADLKAFLASGADKDSEWMTELNEVKAEDFNERKAMEMAMAKEKLWPGIFALWLKKLTTSRFVRFLNRTPPRPIITIRSLNLSMPALWAWCTKQTWTHSSASRFARVRYRKSRRPLWPPAFFVIRLQTLESYFFTEL